MSRGLGDVYKRQVDGHLGDAHNLRDFGDRQELSFIFINHLILTSRHANALQASPPAGRTRTCSNHPNVKHGLSAT